MELWLLLGLLGLLGLLLVGSYNRLITLKHRVDNAWAQIDVQLKRRADLVPNLVETVKGYMRHERETLEAVTEARARLARGGSVGDQAQANSMLSEALRTVFAVAENYPQLKADRNFLMLQEELAGIENKIAYARQYYNDSVLGLNTATERFPTNLVAALFRIGRREYFETRGADRDPVRVQF